MVDVKAVVQRQFGSVALNYSVSPVHAVGEDLTRLVQAAGLTGTERVLDAGCGAGHAALALAPGAAEVVAYDLTPSMLEQVERLAAERGLSNIVTHQGDVEKLPFGDAAFDRVVSRYSAHHWPHPLVALRAFQRVLKPGGLFILSDIIAPDDATLDTFLQTIELLRDPSHVRDHSVVQWLGMLFQVGFDAEVVYTWVLPLDFEAWVQRMATPALNVTMLKALFDGAPNEVLAAMDVQPDYAFSIPGALFRAHKRGVS